MRPISRDCGLTIKRDLTNFNFRKLLSSTPLSLDYYAKTIFPFKSYYSKTSKQLYRIQLNQRRTTARKTFQGFLLNGTCWNIFISHYYVSMFFAVIRYTRSKSKNNLDTLLWLLTNRRINKKRNFNL